MLKGREVRLYPVRPKKELKCSRLLNAEAESPGVLKPLTMGIAKLVSLTKVV